MEAAPASTEFTSIKWGAFTGTGSFYQGMDIPGTQSGIGTGKRNTEIIVEHLRYRENGSAAQLCANLNFGGFNDWFLPSYYELG